MLKKLLSIAIIVLIIYSLLLIPDSKIEFASSDQSAPFLWNEDMLWENLETIFNQARQNGCEETTGKLESNFKKLDSINILLSSRIYPPTDSIFDNFESILFNTSTLTAACPDNINRFSEIYIQLRNNVKLQSKNWPVDSHDTRDRIYRLLYGSRIAFEEILLQQSEETFGQLMKVTEVSSKTPSAIILGTTLHSGDILASRGGAPTSALIARGSDYPGNFSHIALVHIDQETAEVSVIESHIEIGVAVVTLAKYLEDKKLRIMVMRLDPNHPYLIKDPLLPHKASAYGLKRANSENITYDFAMDTENHDKLFCSEVAYDAYQYMGVELWRYKSFISSAGVRNWLGDFGVRNFITQEPSDLEYDPQLQVVAEWRDHETLLKDHLDNAIIDVMLESAEAGERLEYDFFILPIARVLKGYCMIKNIFGGFGSIPEGMSASSALKNDYLTKYHAAVKDELLISVNEFSETNGYLPPYWELIKLAQSAKEKVNGINL